MDLNHIGLTAILVAELYPNSLIGEESSPKNLEAMGTKTEAAITPAAITSPPLWKSLGDNQKNILVIVNSREAVYLPDHELTFLAGVLSACKLSLADVAIVNLNNHPEATYKELTSFFKSKIVFLFDTGPAEFGLPMNFPPYQIQAFAGNSFLSAPSLKHLENDRVEKSKLWECLKRLFNL
jgi:hypothetical protein